MHTKERPGLRILILEGDARDAEIEAQALRDAHPACAVQVVDSRGAFTEALESFAPDVLPSDSSVPGFPVLEALHLLQEHLPPTLLILVCGMLEPAGLQCLKAGAADLVLKGEVARLGPAIQSALEVRAPLRRLSARQCAVLRRLAAGQSTKGIAGELRISVKTIETHRAEVMKRLGIHDLAGLVRYAVHVGIVSALGWRGSPEGTAESGRSADQRGSTGVRAPARRGEEIPRRRTVSPRHQGAYGETGREAAES